MKKWKRPNKLLIKKVSIPLGVVGVIFESRPNVASDIASLCFKSGNAVILRGGSDSFNTSNELVNGVKLENGNYITETLVTHKNSTISIVKKEIPLLD